VPTERRKLQPGRRAAMAATVGLAQVETGQAVRGAEVAAARRAQVGTVDMVGMVEMDSAAGAVMAGREEMDILIRARAISATVVVAAMAAMAPMPAAAVEEMGAMVAMVVVPVTAAWEAMRDYATAVRRETVVWAAFQTAQTARRARRVHV
jgi:hypothetical protein